MLEIILLSCYTADESFCEELYLLFNVVQL